jgi:transcription initiation factor TFIID subunit 2
MTSGSAPLKLKQKLHFKLLHQRVELEVELMKKRIVGFTELTIQPLSKLTTLALHCRQSTVTRVLVNNYEAQWTLKNYAERVVSEKLGECDADTYSTCLKAAVDASDDGELLVRLAANEQNNETGNSLIPNASQAVPDVEGVQPFLTVRIDFELVDAKGGVYFVLPDAEAYPLRAPHMYTCSAASGARVWLPCVDLPSEQCTWEMTYIAEKSLTVISSGTLSSQSLTPDETRKIWKFTSQNERWTASDLVLCVGHFEAYRDPHLPAVTHYCLPHRGNALLHSISFFAQAWRFFETYLNAQVPYASFKQVFVEDAYVPVHVGAGCVVCSTHLLHDARIIDQTFTTRLALARGLAGQWFGTLLHARSLPDTWLVEGLAGYLTYLFSQKMFGINEFRWRILRECEYVCLHPHNQALYQTNAIVASEVTSRLFRTKATLVLYLLERRLGTEGFQKLLATLVQTPFIAAGVSATASNEQQRLLSDTDNTFLLSTNRFLKIAKKVTGQDVRAFAERWVYSRGCPHFICGFWFNRAKHQTEVALKQDLTFSEKMTGTLTIRIHEVDETIDEHQVTIEDEVHLFEFPAHARSRKMRRPGSNTNAAVSGSSGGGGVGNTSSSTTSTTSNALTNGTAAPESSEDMEAESLPLKKTETPLLWLRVDPELHWLRIVTLRMPSVMWLNQLERDRDVVAQYEAIQGLLSFPSSTTLSALNSVLNNRDVFYRIRIHAAQAMSQLTSKETNWLGLDLLFKFFKTHYYSVQTQLPKPNDFANFTAYFLQCAVPEAISRVRDESGHTPSDVTEFILTLLRNNDNSRNSYSDNYYVASLLRALGNVHSDVAHERIRKQIERYLDLEKMMPCYHNVITCACLQTLTALFLHWPQNTASELETLLNRLAFYSKYGHYQEVRVTALECMMRLVLDCSPSSSTSRLVTSAHVATLTRQFLDILFTDKSVWVKHKLLTKWLHTPTEGRDHNRFAVFQPDTPHNVALRHRLWVLLNSELTAYDWRLRLDVLQLYAKVGGGRSPQFKLDPRPKLPTRPPTTSSSRSAEPSGLKFKRDETTTKKGAKSKSSPPSTPNVATNVTSTNKKRKRTDAEDRESVVSETSKPISVIKLAMPKREDTNSPSLSTSLTTTTTSSATPTVSTKPKIKVKLPFSATPVNAPGTDVQESPNPNDSLATSPREVSSSPASTSTTATTSVQSVVRFVNNKLRVSLPKMKEQTSLPATPSNTSSFSAAPSSIPTVSMTVSETQTQPQTQTQTQTQTQPQIPKRLTLRLATSVSGATRVSPEERQFQSQQEQLPQSPHSPSSSAASAASFPVPSNAGEMPSLSSSTVALRLCPASTTSAAPASFASNTSEPTASENSDVSFRSSRGETNNTSPTTSGSHEQ